MTPAERKAAHDQRQIERGLVRLQVWTHPDNKEPLKQLAKMEPGELLGALNAKAPPD